MGRGDIFCMKTTNEDFATWFARQGIRYFSAREVLFRGGSDARLQLNTDPPRELWPKIIPTLQVLDRLRAELGCAITLTSIYRSPAYNARIGGARASYHTQFVACDFQASKGTPASWAAALKRMRSAGIFRGGVGIYPTFVHVDTRGYDANF